MVNFWILNISPLLLFGNIKKILKFLKTQDTYGLENVIVGKKFIGLNLSTQLKSAENAI